MCKEDFHQLISQNIRKSMSCQLGYHIKLNYENYKMLTNLQKKNKDS